MQGDQGLPLLMIDRFVGWICLGILGIVDLDAFALDHNKTGIDSLDLSNKLLLGNGACLGLLKEANRHIFRLSRGSTGSVLGLLTLAAGLRL